MSTHAVRRGRRAREEIVVTTLGNFADATLRERARALRRAWKKVRADRSPGALHDVRVALRRLQAAVALLSPVAVLPRRLRPRRIARIVRRLGAVRDADADIAVLLGLRDGLPAGEFERVEDRLGATLAARDDRLARLLEDRLPVRVRRLDRALRRWRDAPGLHWLAAADAASWLPVLALPAVSGLLAHDGWWADDSPAGTSAVHALRRAAKVVRYQLDELAAAGVPAFAHAHDDLRCLQQALGGLRDADRLLRSLDAATPAAADAVQRAREAHLATWLSLRADLRASVLAARWLTAEELPGASAREPDALVEDEAGWVRGVARVDERADARWDEAAD